LIRQRIPELFPFVESILAQRFPVIPDAYLVKFFVEPMLELIAKNFEEIESIPVMQLVEQHLPRLVQKYKKA
jgi:hypothetical protein